MPYRRLLPLSLAALLTACAAPQAPLYQWGNFSGLSYDALRGEGLSPAEQLQQMLKHGEQVAAKGQQLPPGFRAHLGLLYLRAGQPDAAREAFEAERLKFPESAAFIDFLNKKHNQAAKETAKGV